jgi:hypothetical protein
LLGAGLAGHLDDLLEVVPRTMESSTSSTFLPVNSEAMALSFWRTDWARTFWPGMMKVRPM